MSGDRFLLAHGGDQGRRLLRTVAFAVVVLAALLFAGQVRADEAVAGAIVGTVSADATDATPLHEIAVIAMHSETYDYFDVMTDEDGEYEFTDLPDGVYTLLFFDSQGVYAPVFSGNTVTFNEATSVSVPSVGPIDASMPLGESISGRVVAEEDADESLAGIRVNIDLLDSNSPWGVTVGATTDADGQFDLDGFHPRGSYAAWFNDPGGQRAPLQVVGIQPSQSNLVVSLSPAAAISGQVFDDEGQPIEGIEVSAAPVGGGYWVDAVTDAQGRYVIAGLQEDADYRIEFYDWSGAYLTQYYDGVARWDQATLVKAPAEGINATLTVATTISGTVTDEVDEPIEGIQVWASPVGTGGFAGTAWTNADGEYVISQLQPDMHYLVWFFDPELRFTDQYYDGRDSWWDADPVLAGASGINAVLRGAVTIRGTVTNRTGDPLGDIEVAARTDGQSWWSTEAWTDSDGIYIVAGLVDGQDYELRFRDNDGAYLTAYYDDERDPDDAEPVQAPAEGIDIALDDAESISGMVTARAGGAPLSGIWVTVERVDGREQRTARTASDGSYQVGGLEAGVAHTVQASDTTNWRYATEDYVSVDNDPQVVAPAIGIDLALDTLAVSGQVRTVAGWDPVPDVEVRVVAEDDTVLGSVLTNDDGFYRVDDLIGLTDYELQVSDPEGRVEATTREFWLWDRSFESFDVAVREQVAVALTIVPNAAVTGQEVQLNAQVTAPFSEPQSGTVRFSADGTSLGDAAVSWWDGWAQLPATFDPGTFDIVASFDSNHVYVGGQDEATLTVRPADTALVLDVAPDTTVDAGQALTFSATLEVLPPGAGVPTGGIELLVGGEAQQTLPVSPDGDPVVFEPESLPPGVHPVEVRYAGDDRFAASTSVPVEVTVRTNSQVALASSPATSVVGQDVEVSVTVTSDLAATPTGQVALGLDVEDLPVLDLDADGTARTTVRIDQAGETSITATYLGDERHTASAEASLTQVVTPASTTVGVSVAPQQVDQGDGVTVSAQVTVDAPGGGQPQGQAVLYDGEEVIGSAALDDGEVVFDDVVLDPGVRSLTVDYEGSADHLASVSEPVEVTVRWSTQVVLEPPAATVVGQAASVEVSVDTVDGSGPTPAGEVAVRIDGDEVARGTLEDGAVTLDVPSGAAGQRVLQVAYLGDDTHVDSGASVTQQVLPASTSVEVSVDPQQVDQGDGVTVSAQVTVDAPGGGQPQGEAVLYDGEVEIGSAALVDGEVTFDEVVLDPGVRSLTVDYEGSADHLASVSEPVEVTVRWATQVVVEPPAATVVGQAANVEVSVATTVDGSGPTPAGEVAVRIDGDEVARGMLEDGAVTLDVPSGAAGPRVLQVAYLGDDTHAGSAASVAHEVDPAATTVTLAGPEQAVENTPVTFTAEVAVVAPGGGQPASSVELRDADEVLLATQVLGGGTVAFEVSFAEPGDRTLEARYLGSDDHAAATSAPLTLRVAPEQPVLTTSLSVDPLDGPAPLDVQVVLDATSSDGGEVTFTLDPADGSAPQTGTIAAGDGGQTLAHTFGEPGTYVVTATFERGGSVATERRTVRVRDPQATDLTVAIDVDRTRGFAPHTVLIDLGGYDPDGAALSYTLDPGDGSDVIDGALPVGVLTHVYEEPGRYLLRATVSDGDTEVAAYHWITVDAREAPLAAAGDDRVVVAEQSVLFDAAGSRPPNGIDAYQWDLGDGTSVSGARISHTYTTPGTYEVALTVVVDGEEAHDTATVRVLPVPGPDEGLVVSVQGGGSALGGADVLVILDDGARISGVTDSTGQVRLVGIPDGTRAVYAYGSGYLPSVVQAEISGGAGAVTLTLERGEFGAATLDTRRLNIDEIIDLGIDPDDPDNQFVYEAEVWLYFDQLHEERETARVYYTGSGRLLGWVGPVGPGLPGLPDLIRSCTGGAGGEGCLTCGRAYWYPTVEFVEGHPVIHWLVIPMRASFLKEFFEVSMVVQNLTPGFHFSDGVASLSLPSGLSLAPTTTPQSEQIELPPIPGGSSSTATWFIRGDEEGEYDLAADYVAELEPLGLPVRLAARTQDPLKVWGGSAVRLIVEPDDRAIRWGPYEVFVTIENVADIPVYNPTIALLDRREDAPPEHAEYVYAPLVPQQQGVSVLEPGEIYRGEWVLFPGLGNDEVTELYLIEERSFITQTGGNVSLDVSLEPKPRRLAGTVASTPVVEVTQRPGRGTDTVTVSWQPPDLDGVSGYQVFVRDDTTRDSSWELLEEVDASATPQVEIGASQRFIGRYYAVITLIDDGTIAYAHNLGIGPGRYVALGDGLSSGEGVPEYFLGTANDVRAVPDTMQDRFPHDNRCHRSQRGAFPTIIAADPELRHLLDPFDFVACSGAFAHDLEVPTRANAGEVAQLDRVSEFTDVVTVTLGVEDTAFYEMLALCAVEDCLLSEFVDGHLFGSVLGSGPWAEEFDVALQSFAYVQDLADTIKDVLVGAKSCVTAATNPASTYKCGMMLRKAYKLASEIDADGLIVLAPDPLRSSFISHAYGANSVLQSRLERVYTTLAQRAPNAQVYVPLYPDIAAARAGDPLCPVVPGVSDLFSFSTNEVMAIRRLTQEINRSISQAVATVNAGAGGGRFVLVEADFTDRQLCLNGALNVETAFNGIVSDYSFVPGTQGPTAHSFQVNAAGHRIIADRLRDELLGMQRSLQFIPYNVPQTALTLAVEDGDGALSAVGFAQDGVAEVALRAPDGTVYLAGAGEVSTAQVDAGAIVRVEDPISGTWQVEVTAIGTAGDGTDVEVRAWTDPGRPPAPPTAAGTFQRDSADPTTITLDGSQSTPGDTPITHYEWFVDDGAILDGMVVTITSTGTQARSATLTVVDATGAAHSTDVIIPALDDGSGDGDDGSGGGDDGDDPGSGGPGDDPGSGGPGDGSGGDGSGDGGSGDGSGGGSGGGSAGDGGGETPPGGDAGASPPGEDDAQTPPSDDGAQAPPSGSEADPGDDGTQQEVDGSGDAPEGPVAPGSPPPPGTDPTPPGGPDADSEAPEVEDSIIARPIEYTDVPPGSTHAGAIAQLTELGVTRGCADGRYCPDESVRRDQMASFLVRAFDLDEVDERPFVDVALGSTHDAAISALAASGITVGCGDDRYCPAEDVSRGQMATFLARALDLAPPPDPIPFDDVDPDNPHFDGIQALAHAGVTLGCGDGSAFCPSQTVNRAQMASFLVRAIGLLAES